MAVLVLAGCAGRRPWTKAEIAMQAAATTIMVMDWVQTNKVASNPERWSEMNPILGDHPSTGEVNVYFPLLALGQIVIADALPPTWRKAWLGSWIIGQGAVVIHNKGEGL